MQRNTDGHTFKIHTSCANEQNTITTMSFRLCVIGMSDYFHRKHKLNYITERGRLMIKLSSLHCNYLKCYCNYLKVCKTDYSLSLSALSLTALLLICFQPGPRPVTCNMPLRLHADFDIATQSIIPGTRNASRPD